MDTNVRNQITDLEVVSSVVRTPKNVEEVVKDFANKFFLKVRCVHANFMFELRKERGAG